MVRTQLRRAVRVAYSQHNDTICTSDDNVRWDLVNRVRAEIADGTYLDDAKWEAALDRLADDVFAR